MPAQYEARRRRKGKLSLKSMASSGKRRHRDASVPAGFFRAIHQSDVRDKKLMLPPQYNVDWLSRSATLIVANGHRWEVELTRNKEGIWFGNKGWQRFAEFYSLDYIHTLIFKYKGLSTFTVYIFDTTSMEITYPVSNGDETDGQPPQPHATSSSAQIIDAANAADKLNKKKGKSPIDCNSNKAMMMHEEKLQGPNSDHASEKPSSSRADPVTGGDGFTSVHPFFKIKMNSSYTSRGQPVLAGYTTELYN
ncbi:B3 domain-containing protein At4g01580 [Linum grandiflorum]